MTDTAQDAGARAAAALQDVTLAALAWLDGHREFFRLPPQVTARGVDHNTTLKPLGELTQLSLSLTRVSSPGGPVHRAARALLDFAWQETRQGALYLDLARAEPHATHFVEMYVPFAEAGFHHRGFEDFARMMAGTRSWAATEQEPTRRLSVLRAQQRLGAASTGPADTDAVLRAAHRTWLGGRPEPWAFEGPSGYALTHHVFHVTDWGVRPEGLSDDLAEYLAHWLPAWLDTCLEEEFWDLAGELLAVQASLPSGAAPDGGPTDPVGPAGTPWQRFAAAQGSDGAYAEKGPVPAGDDRGTFLACYHPTLVAAFASALARSRTDAAARCAGHAVDGGRP